MEGNIADIETTIIDQLFLELSQVTQAESAQEIEWRRKYTELIFAVENKYPGETRHETALRYIKERENSKKIGGINPEEQSQAIKEIDDG